MIEPFTVLAPEYTALLARMQITRTAEVTMAANKLIGFIDAGHYKAGCDVTGVPQIVAAASFEREAGSNFNLNPAQGAPLHQRSTIIPHNGPFATWLQAQIAAYQLDGLDKIGAANWSWERACYEEELFNGFGYRAYGIHSPYLWAGSNDYTVGKFVADDKFSRSAVDTQLGIIPMMLRIVQLRSDLALPILLPSQVLTSAPPPAPQPAPEGLQDAAALQTALNSLGVDPPLTVDDNYGRETKLSVMAFQQTVGITADGLAGPETWAAINARLKT